MTSTKDFVDRMEWVSQTAKLIKEAEACRRAGIKSRSQIARARSGKSKLSWDHVAALARVLERDCRVRREWLLFGEEPKLSGDASLGDVVRVGVDVDSVRSLPAVEPRTLKKRRKQSHGSSPNQGPAARQNGRRPKRIRAANVDDR